MFRATAKILLLGVLVAVGAVGVYVYHDATSDSRKIDKLQEEKQQLQQIVQRLSDERRVAEVLVTDQHEVDGVLRTTLLFVEYARDGSSLPPKSFTIDGKTAHIDALVIKFERDFLKENDPLRGHSIALFTKLYGDQQSPASAERIDAPGQIPDVYRGVDPKVSAFEQELWNNFWKLAEDPAYAQRYGVRVANGQGVWGPFEREKLYTITIESDGGLNIASEPLRGIYREALKRKDSPVSSSAPHIPGGGAHADRGAHYVRYGYASKRN